MNKKLRWHEYITINIYWLGLNVATGTITPVLLPFLVAMFVPAAMKNSGLATVRVVGLAAAMLVQPLAGMLSDRNTSRWGRRRPYIFGGVLFNLLFLLIIGFSPSLLGTGNDSLAFGYNAAFIVLIVGIVLLQISSNVTQAATQGLIPDLVPEDQRGRASGVKAVMELLPVFLVMFIGPLVDSGRLWAVIGIVGAAFRPQYVTAKMARTTTNNPMTCAVPNNSKGAPVQSLAKKFPIGSLLTVLLCILPRRRGSGKWGPSSVRFSFGLTQWGRNNARKLFCRPPFFVV